MSAPPDKASRADSLRAVGERNCWHRRQRTEDEGYSAYTPTLPGCFINGSTIEEAQRNIRESIEQHLASLVAHRQPIPQDGRLVQVEELTVGIEG